MPEITLENLKVGLSEIVRAQDVRVRLGAYSEGMTEFDIYREKAQDMRLSLTTKMLAGRAVSDSRTFTLNCPATWWQHLKQRIYEVRFRPLRLRARLMRTHPVRMEKVSVVVDFTSYDAFPRADVPIPQTEMMGYSVRWDEFQWLASGPVHMSDGDVSRGREFVNPRQLTHHLINRVMADASVHTQPRTVSETVSKLLGAWDDTGERGILGQLGCNTAQLVRMGRLEEDMRNRG